MFVEKKVPEQKVNELQQQSPLADNVVQETMKKTGWSASQNQMVQTQETTKKTGWSINKSIQQTNGNANKNIQQTNNNFTKTNSTEKKTFGLTQLAFKKQRDQELDKRTDLTVTEKESIKVKSDELFTKKNWKELSVFLTSYGLTETFNWLNQQVQQMNKPKASDFFSAPAGDIQSNDLQQRVDEARNKQQDDEKSKAKDIVEKGKRDD